MSETVFRILFVLMIALSMPELNLGLARQEALDSSLRRVRTNRFEVVPLYNGNWSNGFFASELKSVSIGDVTQYSFILTSVNFVSFEVDYGKKYDTRWSPEGIPFSIYLEVGNSSIIFSIFNLKEKQQALPSIIMPIEPNSGFDHIIKIVDDKKMRTLYVVCDVLYDNLYRLQKEPGNAIYFTEYKNMSVDV